jgi:hypothetical protein
MRLLEWQPEDGVPHITVADTPRPPRSTADGF